MRWLYNSPSNKLHSRICTFLVGVSFLSDSHVVWLVSGKFTLILLFKDLLCYIFGRLNKRPIHFSGIFFFFFEFMTILELLKMCKMNLDIRQILRYQDTLSFPVSKIQPILPWGVRHCLAEAQDMIKT